MPGSSRWWMHDRLIGAPHGLGPRVGWYQTEVGQEMLRRWMVAVLVVALVPVAMSLTSRRAVRGRTGATSSSSRTRPAPMPSPSKATGLGATVELAVRLLNTLVVSLPLLKVGRLEQDPRVAFVTPDRPVRLLDTAPGAGTSSAAPTGVTRIGAAPVAGVATVTKKAAVAVLDTGIMLRPDLNVVGGFDCATSDLLGDLLGGGGGNDQGRQRARYPRGRHGGRQGHRAGCGRRLARHAAVRRTGLLLLRLRQPVQRGLRPRTGWRRTPPPTTSRSST